MAAPPTDQAEPTPEQYPPGLGNTMDKNVVDQVEVLTRGQWINKMWFAWRKNRITASIAHSVVHCNLVQGRSKTPPKSLLQEITGERSEVETRAIVWGLKKEPVAKRRYEKLKRAELGRRVSVQNCGLFIDPDRNWLGATPDGIVMDSKTGEKLCLEVMCSHKHRKRLVKDACREDPDFCLEIQEGDKQQQEDVQGGNGQPPSYRLKTTHRFYTQVQCQMAVTGLQEADFLVYTIKDTAIARVTFDPDLWEDTVSKLEEFYQDAVLPYLKEKQQQ